EWVDVANDLLRSCHINQHIKHLSECGADVFVRLYESILGEKVPDFIASPRSQEDDAHNVQAVIDSLALDYLQVSLSHITGENIVKGEKESIRNLLEIFDGLLEYLTEEASESSENGDKANMLSSTGVQSASGKQLGSTVGRLPQLSIFSPLEGSQSEFFVPSCDVDGLESNSELIRLGDTAHSFSKRKKGSVKPVHSAEPQRERLSASATKLGEPIQQAVPLLPPFQSSEARPRYPAQRDYQSSESQSSALAGSQGGKILTLEKPLTQKSEDVSGSLPPSRKFPVRDQLLANDAEDNMAKVPWVSETSSASSSHEKCSLSADRITQTAGPESSYLPRRDRQVHFFGTEPRYENSLTDSLEEPPSHRTTKEKHSKQELYEMSEKISRRLNELESMVESALSGQTGEEELTDEDSLSQHSDSVMDYRRRKAERDLPHLRCPSRARSLSPSSSSSQHQLFSELEDKLFLIWPATLLQIRRQLQKERDERKKAKMIAKAYEDQLRFYEARERLRLSKLREVIKEVEQEYKENIFQEPPKMLQPEKVYARKTTPRNPKYSQWIPKGGTGKPKKAAPMKVRDDYLLQLLEEFPHLHISHHTMKKMWQQQLAHNEQLKAASGRARPKVQNEVQEALKRHELLVEIIKKDQDHSRRLHEFKQRIRQQKWTQKQLREKRQQVVRARKYYEDYRVQLRAKMMRARTREERILKNLFEEGLEIQKQKLKDLRAYAKDERAEQRREHLNELESMENYYKDQFSMLAEALSQERQETQSRAKAQVQLLQKTKRDLRSRMEKEIEEVQAAIMQNDDDTFFQELEAERLKSRLQMASFLHSKSCF
ncbi:CEP95 protein, partial [Galbula dea]|nr:CEP95 protein [Galbula dea]